MSKCLETIGYMGDVRNLSKNRAIAIDDKEIVKWLKHSNGTRYATLFYSSDDVWKVGRQQQKLLKINPDLKFKQISNIKEFIDYVDNGMDRNEHPVKDITMINVYSSWEKEEGNRDYVEEARKRHEPEVRQVSREAIQGLADAIFKQTINIFLSNKEVNATKALTDKDVYQRVKDEYGWDQASVVKDGILNVSGIAKDGIDELKDKKDLLTKGVKVLSEVTPKTLLLKTLGPLTEGYGAYTTINNINKSNKKAKNQQKLVEQCFKESNNPKSKRFGDIGRCITLQKDTLINFENDLFESAGYGAFSSKNRGGK